MLPIIYSEAAHTYANTYTCHLCHLWRVQLAKPSVCPPEFPDCVPVCLPVLCVCLFIFLPVCLPVLWSQATRAFLIASSFLHHQNTVKQNTAVDSRSLSLSLERDRVARERQGGQWSTCIPKQKILPLYTVTYWHDSLYSHHFLFASRVLVHLQGGHARRK